VVRIEIALGMALVAGCGAAAPPSATPPGDPRLRALWDRALEAENARADALAGMLGELELHTGTISAHDDQGRLGDGYVDGRIDGAVLAVRLPDEGTTLTIFDTRSHFQLSLDETPIARATLIIPHSSTGGSVGECAECVELGSGRITIDGTFRGTYGDGTPLAIEIHGALQRRTLSQLDEDDLERLLAPALARRGVGGFTIEGSMLALELAAEALEDPEIAGGERCARGLGYRSRIEIDLRNRARRSARIVWRSGFERCCAGERSACSPGPDCRTRTLEH